MAAGVNPPRRRYDSPHRREQAAATRQAILDAAEDLFRRHGYTGTSIPAIAAAAGVAVKTVYLAFQSKSGVVHALWDVRLGGDDEAVTVAQRAWFQAMLAERDPKRLLSAMARQSAAVKERAGPVMDVVRDAATADPDVGALWERIQSEFRSMVVEPLASHLGTLGALAPDVDVTTAADILWTLNHPDVWRLLSACGWDLASYERWLTATLQDQLLAAGATAPPSSPPAGRGARGAAGRAGTTRTGGRPRPPAGGTAGASPSSPPSG